MSTLNRKGFLKLLKTIGAALGIGAVAAPVVAYFYPPELEELPSEPIPVGPEADLPPGESTMVQFGRYPAIVIHTEAGIKAYSAVCTHFACICKWDEEQQVIFCPCHEGYFEPLEGGVIAGPPPLPLQKIPVAIIDGEIMIGGSA